ncbi:unnamed protein product [Fraxinus pennsylvanica]|uniref:Amidase domain-containing protein n=1 Tax=Fraxinus pennsylvanica TaxID=56036 RepID=A0AAD2E1S5_9LAMI|nr:unnamed protein product [Fraxinus pennsylvanica]
MARNSSDYGAYTEKFTLQPPPSSHQLPLTGLIFAVKDIFDVEGYVTGFGNPDWASTHSAAVSTAPAVLDMLKAVLVAAAAADADEDSSILAMPTVPGPPPKLQTEPTTLETFCAKAFTLLSVAGLSGFCQVSIPLGTHDGLPIAVSLLANHGSDGFLLDFVESIDATLERQ